MVNAVAHVELVHSDWQRWLAVSAVINTAVSEKTSSHLEEGGEQSQGEEVHNQSDAELGNELEETSQQQSIESFGQVLAGQHHKQGDLATVGLEEPRLMVGSCEEESKPDNAVSSSNWIGLMHSSFQVFFFIEESC